MKRPMILVAAGALCFAETSVAESSSNKAESGVSRARDALRKRLLDAETDGVVALRGRAPSADVVESTITPPKNVEAKPALRVDAELPRCLSIASLAASRALLGDGPMSTIEVLRGRLIDGSIGDRGQAEFDLAVAYLVSGLAEEARAIARAWNDVAAAEIVVLADIMTANTTSRATARSTCSTFSALIEHSRNLMRGVSPGLDEGDFAKLAALPAPMRAAIVESLTPFALEHEELGAAAALRKLAVANYPNASAAQVMLAHTGALTALDASAVTEALTPIALEPGELQQHAAEALSTGGQIASDELEYAAELAQGSVRNRLELLLAARKLDENHLVEAVRLFARAGAGELASSQGNWEKVARVLEDKIGSTHEADRLQAVAAIVEAPDRTAPLLSEKSSRSVVQWMIAHGLPEKVDSFFAARGAKDDERNSAITQAFHIAGGQEIASPANQSRSDDTSDLGLSSSRGGDRRPDIAAQWEGGYDARAALEISRSVSDEIKAIRERIAQ